MVLMRSLICVGCVGAWGAVVAEGLEVRPGGVVVGVPARITRQVDDALRARIRGTWEHYIAEAERHRTGRFPIAKTSL
jgi:carbonic anhydrase/acetyltransferase-like protein (isoleucine patch superfamily)